MEDKARQMIEWYDGRELPECPFKVNECTKVIDAAKYVEANISTMQYHAKSLKRGVGVSLFKLSYMRLYELKKYIEANK